VRDILSVVQGKYGGIHNERSGDVEAALAYAGYNANSYAGLARQDEVSRAVLDAAHKAMMQIEEEVDSAIEAWCMTCSHRPHQKAL
jgi:hypothetical protein